MCISHIHTCSSHRANAILVQSESFFQCVRSHLLVEHVAAGEIEDPKVVLILGNETDVDSTEDGGRRCPVRGWREGTHTLYMG